MRGRYNLMDWEIQKWKYKITTEIGRLARDGTYEADLTSWDICPANVCQILELLGWEEDNFDKNGWQCDVWYTYCHQDYPFKLVLFYQGFIFEMKLYAVEKE